MEPVPFYAALLLTSAPALVWLWLIIEYRQISLRSTMILETLEGVALAICAAYWRSLAG
jgi:hypothetical protein